jgi:membrane dipeptidase
MADGYYRVDLPRVDLHSHAGRCFLAGLPAGHSLVAALGAAAVADAVRAARARAAGLTVLTLVHYRVSEIGDVQTEAPVHGGLSRFGRDVVAECNRLSIVIDCAHASFATTMAVLEASSQPVIISHGQLGYPEAGSSDTGSSDTGHPRLMTAPHVSAVAAAGGLIGGWPSGFTSRSLADFGTEIIRLADVAGPDHVALGTDLDGNYRPVLTSYDQLDDLTAQLRDRGLPPASVHQILGGNALGLLRHLP